MAVIIGVDPHKATHTAVVIDGREEELGRKRNRPLRPLWVMSAHPPRWAS